VEDSKRSEELCGGLPTENAATGSLNREQWQHFRTTSAERNVALLPVMGFALGEDFPGEGKPASEVISNLSWALTATG
jgi:hypothetical protein